MNIGLIIVLAIIFILVSYIGFSVYTFRKKVTNYDPNSESENLTILNDNTFSHKIAGNVALVDFWAPWCQPCKIQGPIISDLAEDYHSKAKICKLDVEKNQKIAHKLGIRNIPTIVIFKNGQEVDRLVGLKTKNVLKKAIDKYL
ncbi:MAG: thioredoxin [Bacteroidales bacterium]|nr:thioredoxin [Bacteroidales bacterium]